MVDAFLLVSLYYGTAAYGHATQIAAMVCLGVFMFFAKFLKNMDHYIKYPEDLLLVPCAILFGWFHGFIKIYSLCTINVVCLSSGRIQFVPSGHFLPRSMPIVIGHNSRANA